MLKRVVIKGFRSCHDVVLDDLGPLTVLVGRNAAGKSNILRAISRMASTATSSEPFRVSHPFAFADPKKVAMRIILGQGEYDYSFDVHLRRNRTTRRVTVEVTEMLSHRQSNGEQIEVFKRRGVEVKLADGKTVTIPSGVPCMPAIVSVLPPESEIVRQVRSLLENLEAMRYYPLPLEFESGHQQPIVRQSDYNQWLTRKGGLDAAGTDILMRLLDLKLTREEEFAEIQRLVGRNGLGLVDAIHVDKFPNTPRPRTQEETWYRFSFTPSSEQTTNPSQVLDLDELSSGTQRLIRIITSLIYDRSAVMLLEHPEDGIHEGLLWKLIDILQGYSDQSQVIIASHSAAVFNAVPPEAIRLVTMEEGETKVRPLSRQELGAAATYLKEEGTLADFLEMVPED
jgi:predicted ATPase